MDKFRVPVVVFTEVEAVDYGDAVHIAEKAIIHSFFEVSEKEYQGRDVLEYASHGHTHSVTVVSVGELNQAFHNQTLTVFSSLGLGDVLND